MGPIMVDGRATTSLPTPDSPLLSTVVGEGDLPGQGEKLGARRILRDHAGICVASARRVAVDDGEQRGGLKGLSRKSQAPERICPPAFSTSAKAVMSTTGRWGRRCLHRLQQRDAAHGQHAHVAHHDGKGLAQTPGRRRPRRHQRQRRRGRPVPGCRTGLPWQGRPRPPGWDGYGIGHGLAAPAARRGGNDNLAPPRAGERSSILPPAGSGTPAMVEAWPVPRPRVVKGSKMRSRSSGADPRPVVRHRGQGRRRKSGGEATCRPSEGLLGVLQETQQGAEESLCAPRHGAGAVVAQAEGDALLPQQRLDRGRGVARVLAGEQFAAQGFAPGKNVLDGRSRRCNWPVAHVGAQGRAGVGQARLAEIALYREGPRPGVRS